MTHWSHSEYPEFKLSLYFLYISSHAPHIHFVADTIGALGWIVSGDRPSHFIRESYDSGKHHVKHIPGESRMPFYNAEKSPLWQDNARALLASKAKINVFLKKFQVEGPGRRPQSEE